MAQNKTQPTKLSVTAFIARLDNEAKRADAKALVKLMRSESGEKPRMWGPSIIGFGSYHYSYESGREGDMPVIAFSPRKTAIVMYGVSGPDGSKALLKKLGRHSMGKGCVYIKKLADVDNAVLTKIIANAMAAGRD